MNKDDVCLVAGNLLLIEAGFVQRLRSDLINSVFFSQLYADSQAGKFAAPEKWYKGCANAMEKIKWQRPDYTSRDFEPEFDTQITLKDFIGNKFLELFGMKQSSGIERLMDSIEHSHDKKIGLALRDHSVASIKKVGDSEISTIALQLGLFGAGPALHSVFICFSTIEEVETDFFNQCFSGEHIVGQVSVDIARQVLDLPAFERGRIAEKILEQLPDSRDQLVLELSAE